MKIIQIGLEWFPEQGGGLDRVYYDCTRYLPKVGVELNGLVAGTSNVAKSSQGKIFAFAPPNISLLQRWLELRKLFTRLSQQNHYSLVVSHFALHIFPLLNLLDKRPLVTHFQGPWALESKIEGNNFLSIRLKKAIEKISYNRSSSFIVLCQEFQNLLHHEYGIPLSKIHVIPAGVDLDRFNIDPSQTEARKKLGWDTNKTILFCIRRLAKRMGLENLITAMDRVCKLDPDVILYIAGKGKLASELEAKIAELGLAENIKLLGYVPDEQLPLYYRAANFSVVPTIALEGFGLIVIESLAAGTPVIGTPIGGIYEILKPFSEDLVLKGSTSEQIADGIIEALQGKRKLPSESDCLNYVRNNYDWNVVAKKIKQVYQEAIS